MAQEFEYDNLIGRPSGAFLRMGKRLSRNIRNVQKLIPLYAAAWSRSNVRELADASKPLWVVLGDSMAQGIGADRYDHGWPGFLRERLRAAGRDYRLVNLSISGARISDVLERQVPAMEALGDQPALVTMMIGSNDLNRKRYRRRAPTDFQVLLEHLPAGSVIANLPGRGAVQTAIDDQLRSLSDKYVIVDMKRHGVRDWRGRLASDHFHPNEVGYEALAAVFAHDMGL